MANMDCKRLTNYLDEIFTAAEKFLDFDNSEQFSATSSLSEDSARKVLCGVLCYKLDISHFEDYMRNGTYPSEGVNFSMFDVHEYIQKEFGVPFLPYGVSWDVDPLVESRQGKRRARCPMAKIVYYYSSGKKGYALKSCSMRTDMDEMHGSILDEMKAEPFTLDEDMREFIRYIIALHQRIIVWLYVPYINKALDLWTDNYIDDFANAVSNWWCAKSTDTIIETGYPIKYFVDAVQYSDDCDLVINSNVINSMDREPFVWFSLLKPRENGILANHQNITYMVEDTDKSIEVPTLRIFNPTDLHRNSFQISKFVLDELPPSFLNDLKDYFKDDISDRDYVYVICGEHAPAFKKVLENDKARLSRTRIANFDGVTIVSYRDTGLMLRVPFFGETYYERKGITERATGNTNFIPLTDYFKLFPDNFNICDLNNGYDGNKFVGLVDAFAVLVNAAEVDKGTELYDEKPLKVIQTGDIREYEYDFSFTSTQFSRILPKPVMDGLDVALSAYGFATDESTRERIKIPLCLVGSPCTRITARVTVSSRLLTYFVLLLVGATNYANIRSDTTPYLNDNPEAQGLNILYLDIIDLLKDYYKKSKSGNSMFSDYVDFLAEGARRFEPYVKDLKNPGSGGAYTGLEPTVMFVGEFCQHIIE